MHSHWRDCLAWEKEKLPLSTASDKAARMFDASLTQYVTMYEDETVNGLTGSLTEAIQSDPDFLMAHVLSNGLQLVSSSKSPFVDSKFKQDLADMWQMAELQKSKGSLSERELRHAEAVWCLGQGQNMKACNLWRGIVLEHPHDTLAIKFFEDRSVFLGDSKTVLRDTLNQVVTHWNESVPLYPFVLGMQSFALFETEEYPKSERIAREAIALYPRESWAIHSVAHCMEMCDRTDEGIKFLQGSTSNWNQSEAACHLNWHEALFNIEKGHLEEALTIFDLYIEKKARSHSMFNLIDATSLLFRLQLLGVDVSQRWKSVYEYCLPHLHNHLLPFNDFHMCMAYVNGAPDTEKQKSVEFFDSLSEFLKAGHTDHKHADTGLAICQAILAYQQQDYTAAADALLSNEWMVIHTGGSDAQRDVIEQLMIAACIKSSKAEHRRAAKRLLASRKFKHPTSLTERLIAMSLACHDDGQDSVRAL